jgi:uncharacterized membrane protein YqhA
MDAPPQDDDGATGGPRPVWDPPLGRGFAWTILTARLLVLFPVVVLVLSGLAAFIYGGAYFLYAVVHVSEHPFPVKDNLGVFLIDLDLFLIGATLLLIAVGFYGLALSGGSDDRRGDVPEWLDVRNLDDMKTRIMSMLTLIAVTSFVDVVVDFHGGRDILYLGVAIALVIVAITAFLRFAVAARGRH